MQVSGQEVQMAELKEEIQGGQQEVRWTRLNNQGKVTAEEQQ